MSLPFSRHARTRMQQRGIDKFDVQLIVRYGYDVRRGLRLLRRRDIDKAARKGECRIQDLERLRNCAVVMEGDHVITCYHLHGPAGHRALRTNNCRCRRSAKRNWRL